MKQRTHLDEAREVLQGVRNEIIFKFQAHLYKEHDSAG